MLAAAFRLPGLFHDLPYSFYGDELHLVKRAMALGTGDLNPHWFTKPAGLLYLLLAVYGSFYLVLAALGEVTSPEAFGAWFLADQGPFLLLGRLLVFAFGLAAVLFCWLFVRHLFASAVAASAVAAVVAVLPAFVHGSLVVKEDVPAAAFALAGLWLLVRATDSSSRPYWDLVAAGALFGLSTATKFYGLLFLPAALVWLGWGQEAAPANSGGRWQRLIYFLSAYALTTFAATPYTFLDPTSQAAVLVKFTNYFAKDVVAFNPDNYVVFKYGPAAIPGALKHLFSLAVEVAVLGPLLLALAVLGMFALYRTPHRWALATLLLLPIFCFILIATTIYAYHPSPRHFVAMLPLVVSLAWLGATWLARPLAGWWRQPQRRVAVAILLLAALPNAAESAARTYELTRLDSRVVATEWIRAHLPADARILLDDYGPVLTPSPAAAARQLAILAQLPPKEAFTAFQRERLELLIRYPAPSAFDLDELGHPWWWWHQLSQEEIWSKPQHRRKSSPLKLYEPPTLAELQERGYRYVITNDEAAGRYRSTTAHQHYPDYVRFYEELKQLPPLVRFDPADWGGKGPVVKIYRVPGGASSP